MWEIWYLGISSPVLLSLNPIHMEEDPRLFSTSPPSGRLWWPAILYLFWSMAHVPWTFQGVLACPWLIFVDLSWGESGRHLDSLNLTSIKCTRGHAIPPPEKYTTLQQE